MLLELAEHFTVLHFPELGLLAPDAAVDVALVEGSVSTAADVERLRRVRAATDCLVALGACAVSGGLQSLRGLARDRGQWPVDHYPYPEWLDLLEVPAAVGRYVKVDAVLWGCPVDHRQVARLLCERLAGVAARPERRPVCMECKQLGVTCRIVAGGEPCLGPVTRAGCGALCPRLGRACYGCFGAADFANVAGLGARLALLGLGPDDVARRFRFVAGDLEVFRAFFASEPAGPETP
jgi:coenzyme F420-reducing hydrogenase gamma subunit